MTTLFRKNMWFIMSICIIFYFHDSLFFFLFFLCNNNLFSIWFENIWLFQISNQARSCVSLCWFIYVFIYFQNVEKSHGKISVSSKLKSGTGLLPVCGVRCHRPSGELHSDIKHHVSIFWVNRILPGVFGSSLKTPDVSVTFCLFVSPFLTSDGEVQRGAEPK